MTFNLITYVTFEITFIFSSQYISVTYKPDLVLYRALLVVYEAISAEPQDSSIGEAETCCCYK